MEGNVNENPLNMTYDPFMCHHIFNSEDVIIVYIKKYMLLFI